MIGASRSVTRPGQRLLVLGGSTEASELIRAVSTRAPNIEVVLSYAGRTLTRNAPPQGVVVRVGGFGGIIGLEDHLRTGGVTAMIDATHPFAAHMPFHAAAACRTVGVPLLRIVRPVWTPEPADQWIHVPTIPDAARAVQHSGARRALLTIGRQELQPFADCDADFVVRSIDPPDPALLPDATILLARAPFTLEGELAVLRTHRIDLVVSKNAGGVATRPKIDAARQLGIPVVMVDCPPAPPVDTVVGVDDALIWIADHFGASA